MEKEEILLKLKEIIESDLPDIEKRKQLLQYHENDIADVTDELDPELRTEVFRILGNETAGEVLLHSDDISEVVENLEPEHIASIIETMDADDAIDILEELDDEKREEVESIIKPEIKEDIDLISNYDDDEIGSKMTNNYVTIESKDTVKSAMKKVIAQAADNDNVSVIYVLDKDEKYYGVIELRDLIIARDGAKLEEIVKKNYPYFLATTKVEDCLVDLKEYGLDSYPILDEEDHLVGVITSEDVIEAIDEEGGDDYVKLAGIIEEEDINESVLQSVKKRIPWLLALLALGLIQSFTMSGFEAVVAALPIIIFFQTLVLDMAGNTGTQSLAVTIRLLSTTDVDKKTTIRTVLKEIRIGFFNGLILATLAFGIVMLYLSIAQKGVQYGNPYSIEEAVKGSSIVAISLLTAMTVSSLIGTIVPMFFKKIKIDPAVASGPFITTINDITALLIYYGLAALLFTIAI